MNPEPKIPSLASTQDEIELEVSEHAFERARKRLHWCRNSTIRMTRRALFDGRPFQTLDKRLRCFLRQSPWDETRSQLYLHGRVIYAFLVSPDVRKLTLATVMTAEPKLCRELNKQELRNRISKEFMAN